MQPEILGAVTILICVMIASISAQWRRARQTTLAMQLLERGVLTRGKVVALSRPLGLPHQVQIYFNYEVPGRGQMLQSCSLDMRALRQEHGVDIPTVGADIAVRFLPHEPTHAVIPQLVPCLSDFKRATLQSSAS